MTSDGVNGFTSIRELGDESSVLVTPEKIIREDSDEVA